LVYLLVFLAAVFTGLAVWSGRVQTAVRRQEMEDYKVLRADLIQTKKEVITLLGQMEQVSVKIVEEIEAKVEEARQYEVRSRKDDHDIPNNEISEKFDTDRSEDPNVTGEDAKKAKPVNSKLTGNNTIVFPRRHDTTGIEPASGTGSPGQELTAKHQMVYALAQLGFSGEEIARQMNIGKGEVMLMLQLKRKGEEVNA